MLPARSQIRWRPGLALLLISLAEILTGSAAAQSPSFGEPPPLVRDQSDYRLKRWLRRRLFDEEDEAKYGIHRHRKPLDEQADRPLIIQIHGYNSTHARNRCVMRPFADAGFPCAGFDYPNDHAVAESAERLSRALRQLARTAPQRRVILVTHSMGGLVARACIEDPRLNPGNVDRLMMIAPPTHGTMLAHVAVATDVWEHWLDRDHGSPWRRWHDSVIDGLGEAADDLAPASPFLTELNARPRNPEVEYTIFLGTSAAMQQDEMDWLREKLQNARKAPGLRRVAGNLDYLLGDLEELVDGKGDGVVAVKRGRLEGVGDTVLLPFGHLSVTGEAASDVVRQVQEELLSRVP